MTLLKRKSRPSFDARTTASSLANRVEGYLGEVPELPGCVTAGETAEEALVNLDEAMAVWIESALVHGDPIPEPVAGPVRLSA
ncbi:MAG: hypothetical protein C0506_02135 [Anaerolinea sp.]|nr:hypothetical protein [Anaerolinea sp.]